MTSPSTDRRFGLNSATAIKAPCRVAATSNLALSGLQTVDGVSLVAGDRVLVAGQTNGIQNGIYVADTGTWQRDNDFDDSRDVSKGTIGVIMEGAYHDQFWIVTTSGTIRPGNTSINFAIGIPQMPILALTTGAFLIGFQRSGSGTVPVTVGDKLQEIPSLKDFGVVGDGVTSDSAALQKRLDLRGYIFINKPAGGIYLISNTLVVHSNSHVVFEPGTILRQASGINKSLIVNEALQNAWVDVTSGVTWTAGTNKLLISWASHGLVVGDAVYLDCAGTSVYNGVFTVIEVPNANTFWVRLRGRPTTNPVGTCRVKKADVDITIEMPTLDYNFTQNSDGMQSPNTNASYFSGVRGLRLYNVAGKDTKKYVVATQGLLDFEIIGAGGYGLHSDALKVYGPAFDGKVKCYGYPGDDMLSFQTREPAAFIAYQVASGGDIRDIEATCRMDHGLDGVAAMTSIYPASWGSSIIDMLTLRGYSGHCESVAINIFDQEGTGGKIGSLRILDFDATVKQVLFSSVSGAVTGPTNIDTLEVRLGANIRTTTGADLIEISDNVQVGMFRDAGTSLGPVTTGIGNGSYLQCSGQIDTMVFEQTKYRVTSLRFVRLSGADKTIKAISFNGCDISVTGELLKLQPAVLLNNPEISINGGLYDCQYFVDLKSSARIVNNGGRLSVSQQFLTCAELVTFPVVDVYSNVDIGSTGDWFGITGNCVVNPKSFAIRFNLNSSAINRGAGNMMTTSAGAGTIPAGAPAICDETNAANSWHSVKDPTVEKF